MALPVRKGYTGAPAQAVLTNSPTNSDTSFVVDTVTGWATTFPFYCVVEPGTSKEEKVKVTAISGVTLTVVRSQDDTSNQGHNAGSVIYPVFTADEADEANLISSAMTTKGDLIATDGSSINRLGVGTNTHVLQADSTSTNGVKWGQIVEAGIADSSVTSAKIVNGTIVDADLNASAAITLTKLGTGALPTTITVASANIVNGTIVSEDLATNAVATTNITDLNVTTAKLADLAVTTGKLAASSVSYPKLESTVLNVLPPIASVMQFMGTAEPTGWKFCNGQTLVIADYPDLYALLTSGGTVFRYGANPTGSSFVLPNMQHRVPVGLGTETEFDTLGEVGGSKTGLQSHDHTYSGTVVNGGSHNHGGVTGQVDIQHTHTFDTRTNDVGTHGHGSTSRVAGGSSSNNPVDQTQTTGGLSAGSTRNHDHSIPTQADHAHTFSGTVVSAGTASGNLQPYMVVNHIIRVA